MKSCVHFLMGLSPTLFLYFRPFNTVDSKTNVQHTFLPMTGFEPWTYCDQLIHNHCRLDSFWYNNVLSDF